MKGRIHIFGHRGFVGSEFWKELERNGQQCGHYHWLGQTDRNDFEVFGDCVIDFISTVDNYNVFENPYLDIDTNLTLLIKLLENWRIAIGYSDVMKKQAVFNYISTWFVYGEESPKEGTNEDAVCNPRGFYSITKRAAEQLLISYCKTYGLNWRILRLSGVLGPGDRKVSTKKNALQYLIKELQNDRPIELYDGGNFTRDYIDVRDCASAIHLVIDKGNMNEIYNIGSGYPYYFESLISYVKRVTNSKSKIKSIPQKPFHKNVQAKSFHMDVTKLKNLGFKPKYSMDDTLDSIIDENRIIMPNAGVYHSQLVKIETGVVNPLTADTLLAPSLRNGQTYRYQEPSGCLPDK